ncbi:MAG: hypothetical protein ACYTF8_02000 [Planctomycetota bacterium]|jgi:hypothetical protein
MRHIRNRKTAPKVRDGKVQRKNRTDLSRHYRQYIQDEPFIDRLRPGAGYRHILLKRDVSKFIGLLPDWEELSRDLDAIVLVPGEDNCLGWHTPGLVAVCAWERELFREWTRDFVDEHRAVLDRLSVVCEPQEDDTCLVHWTEASIRGFQLMHVLLHELGHHHDRITTRSMVRASRGEFYAEQYALAYADRIWDEYFKVFGW